MKAFVVYLLVTLSWNGKVHGRTGKQSYEDDLFDRAINPEEKEVAQTADDKRRPEVYQEEDLPNVNDYRLQDQDLRRENCIESSTTRNGLTVDIKCKKGCRLTCAPILSYK